MILQEGQFIHFIPPKLDGNTNNTKKRYLLILNIDNTTNTIQMLNVSSLKGKEHKLLYDSNFLIQNYFPLPLPTFVKLDVLYIVHNFKFLSKYIAFNGIKLNNSEFSIIKSKYSNFIKNNSHLKIITYTKEQIKKLNS